MSKQKKEQRRWSYSSLSCFAHCPYEYYLQYIVSDDDLYLSEGNFYAETGSFAHHVLELILKGELPPEDAADYVIEHYDDAVCYKTRKETMTKTYCAILSYFADFNADILQNYHVFGVEQEVKFMLDDHPFIGYIDLILEDSKDGGFILVDHKSSDYPFTAKGAVKKNSAESFASYKRQMYLYAHAFNQLYGEFPKALAWNHFKCGGKIASIPFNESEYNESLDWFRDRIKKIEKEESFEPSMDYFYCKNLCNFRNSCDYVKFVGDGW